MSTSHEYGISLAPEAPATHPSSTEVKRLEEENEQLKKLFEHKDKPVIRTDNGPQFISHAFEAACKRFQIEHERIPPRTPNMNVHIEAFHHLLKEECLGRIVFNSYEEVYQSVMEYIRFYNERRIHLILDLSSYEFHKRAKTETLM
jgi:putative transposase